MATTTIDASASFNPIARMSDLPNGARLVVPSAWYKLRRFVSAAASALVEGVRPPQNASAISAGQWHDVMEADRLLRGSLVVVDELGVAEAQPERWEQLEELLHHRPSRIGDRRDAAGRERARDDVGHERRISVLVENVGGDDAVEHTEIRRKIAPVDHARARLALDAAPRVRAREEQRVLVVVAR